MAAAAHTSCYDVAIIGGGASGLAAACTAARAGARVVVLERDVALGLPILATGNGRCNLSNRHLDPARYRHPDCARAVMGDRAEEELEAFFSSVGIVTCSMEDRLYPMSKRAESVRDALLNACTRAGVNERCGITLLDACYQPDQARWTLTLETPTRPLRAKGKTDGHAQLRAWRRDLAAAPRVVEQLGARRIIIACGGTSGEVAELFQLPHLAETPQLCPIACTLPHHPRALKELDGMRSDAKLTLKRARQTVWTETGEVLFRTYGITGVAAFNLSRRVQPGDELIIDPFYQFSDDAFTRLEAERSRTLGGSWKHLGAAWFDGLLVRPLAEALLHEHSDESTCPRTLRLAVQGTTEERVAQVRRGGIPFEAIDLSSLTVHPAIAPALSACGESLDMDADCGGYNLAWAWLSGMRAASSVVKELGL